MNTMMKEDELRRMAALLQVELTPAVRDTLQAIYLNGYNVGSKEMSHQWMAVIDKVGRAA